MSDYWIVRRGNWNVPQLYEANGIYWFQKGLNWKAFLAWTLAVFPSMPGFVAETTLKGDGSSVYDVGEGWIRVFQLNYFV